MVRKSNPLSKREWKKIEGNNKGGGIHKGELLTSPLSSPENGPALMNVKSTLYGGYMTKKKTARRPPLVEESSNQIEGRGKLS